MNKQCKECNEVKSVEDFYKGKAKCKKCVSSYQSDWYWKRGGKAKIKKYKKDNWEEISKKNAKYHKKNKKRQNQQKRDWYYNKGGKERTLEYQREYHQKPKVAAARSYRKSLRGVLDRVGTKKEKHTIEYLGYSASDYKEHIESLWKPGMSWENYGQGKGTWQIDHIKEVMQYVEEGVTDTKIIHSLSNLQPLWDDEHHKKSGEFLHQRKLDRING
jgi:hypothetical protein